MYCQKSVEAREETVVCRASYYYKSTKSSQAPLRLSIKELPATRVGYGYKRIYILLRREGWKVNHIRVYRLYCEEGLHLRSKRSKRRISVAHRANRPMATRINESWSMNFVSDIYFNGRRIRPLTVVDSFSREYFRIWLNQSIRSEDVVRFMKRISLGRGFPERVFLDNGPEFIHKVLDKWAYENKVTLDFSRQGKPTDNAFIESFNGSFRDECLNLHWFLSLNDAKEKIETVLWAT